METAGTMWGGRFNRAPDPLLRQINDSLAFDYRLAVHDITGSIAWARALARAGVLTGDQETTLVGALETLAERVRQDPELVRRSDVEDVHSWVEAELVRMVGDLGKRLHTGRSRNDQVATDLRLWVRDEIDARLAEIREAQRALLDLAQRELDPPHGSPRSRPGPEQMPAREPAADPAAPERPAPGPTIMPGYTHLQRAQPVLMSHWALAYFEMLDRDAARFREARRRVNVCPLGSGALAGTGCAIDRVRLARELGFDAPTANSLDAVADRDFVIETLAVCALCAVHLSRLAEELILFATAEFGFVQLDDAWCSGSSLMPQKKNPDALELVRGKCGRIVGAHTALCMTLKGLPLAYNKDLQEDKEPLFDAMASLSLCLRVIPGVLDTLTIDRATCRDAARGGHANATDLADYLVRRGVPFRDAHHAAGRLVRRALEQGVPLERLPLAEMQAVHEAIGPDVHDRLTLEASIAARDVPGGTAEARVRQALAEARARWQSPTPA